MLLAGLTAWAAGPAEDQVRAAEKRWAAALISGDQAALGRIFSDQLIYGHASGVVDTKKSYLDKLKSGAQTYKIVEFEKMTVQAFGGSAVVHGFIRMAGSGGGQPFDNKGMMVLHTWVKTGAGWQLAAHQTARVP